VDIDPPLSVSLSRPTFHALRLVARIDEIALEEIVETLVAAYLETRLRAILQSETTPRGVIDLTAWREERGAATPGRPDWRWRIVNDAGEILEESDEGFPSVAMAIAKGTERLEVMNTVDRSERPVRIRWTGRRSRS
jgi:hypothetical protein